MGTKQIMHVVLKDESGAIIQQYDGDVATALWSAWIQHERNGGGCCESLPIIYTDDAGVTKYQRIQFKCLCTIEKLPNTSEEYTRECNDPGCTPDYVEPEPNPT